VHQKQMDRISELEAELASERTDHATTTSQLIKAEAVIAKLKGALAAANKVIDAMETFIDSCTYHMRDGNTVSYTGPRAEEGSGDE